jgi:predicted chitinase
MILTPGFLYYGVIVLVKKILTSFRLKKLAKPSEIEKALSDIQISYNHVSAQTHLLLTNPGHDTGELKEMLEALKYSSEGLLDLLNKKSEAKKTEQEPVNLE